LRRASILVLPCLIGGALIAGCGGGDDSSSTEAALSKSAYLAQGNAICRKADAQLSAEAKKTFGNSSPSQAELSKFGTDTAIPIIEDELAQLRALPAPTGDEETVVAIFDAADDGLAKLKETPTLIVNGNEAFAKANKLAKSYGLTACAS
jgi:hypothetical protein